jgi:hypothetical protein
MSFLIWHLSAIVVVICIAFLIGYSFGKYKEKNENN